jgi:hypothetical protein
MTQRTPASAPDPRSDTSTTTTLMGVALLVALLIVLAVYWGPHLDSHTPEKLSRALRATARWSFVWFYLASTGGALKTLFGDRFRSMAQHGRDFGLAFAAAHLAHAGLVAWLYFSYGGPGIGILIFFSIGLFFTYLLALLSIQRMTARLDPTAWRWLRTIGIEYISLNFLYDFARNPFSGGWVQLAAYLPFLVLAVSGPLLRIAAVVQKYRHTRVPDRAHQSLP